MNIKNWYNSLKPIQTVLNSMSNLGKFTDNMSTQAASTLTKEYSAAIQGLTKDQATLALTMAKVDAEKQKEYVNEIQKNQQEVLSQEKSALEGYMKGVTDAGSTALASGYDKLSEKQQNLATSLLSSLTLDDIQDFKDADSFEIAEQEWVNNIVSSVSSMSYAAKAAYDDLQTSIANPGDLTRIITTIFYCISYSLFTKNRKKIRHIGYFYPTYLTTLIHSKNIIYIILYHQTHRYTFSHCIIFFIRYYIICSINKMFPSIQFLTIFICS